MRAYDDITAVAVEEVGWTLGGVARGLVRRAVGGEAGRTIRGALGQLCPSIVRLVVLIQGA